MGNRFTRWSRSTYCFKKWNARKQFHGRQTEKCFPSKRMILYVLSYRIENKRNITKNITYVNMRLKINRFELEKQLSGYKHLLHLQRTWVWFPEPILGSFQPPASGDPLSSLRLDRHLHSYASCACTHTYTNYWGPLESSHKVLFMVHIGHYGKWTELISYGIWGWMNELFHVCSKQISLFFCFCSNSPVLPLFSPSFFSF